MRTDSQNGGARANVLPLFRAEAIAAQQQKLYGEILLIRPFSLTFLSLLALAIAAGMLGFLFFGHYTEKLHMTGVVSSTGALADFYVSERAAKFLHQGDHLQVRCRACAAPKNATVEQISITPQTSPETSPQSSLSAPATYKVTLRLPPTETGARVEADLSLGRKPLLNWLFDKSGT